MRTAMMVLGLALVLHAAPVQELTEAELRERALKLNKEANNEDNANAKLKELNKDKLNSGKLVKAAAKILKEAKPGDKPFRFYASLVLAKSGTAAKEYDAAEAFYAYALENAIKDLQSGKLIALAGNSQIDFYMMRKQYDKAAKACEKLLNEDYEETSAQGQGLFIFERRVRALIRDGKVEEGLSEFDDRTKRFKGGFLVMNMKAGLLRDAGKFDEALELYKETLEKLNNDSNLPDETKKIFASSLRYSLSGLFTEMNRLDDAVAELEKLITLNPDNPTFKNDLGFLLADNDRQLDRAEKLVKDAVEMDIKNNKKLVEAGKMDAEAGKKANSAYVDSLGWVLYKKKKYDDALKHLLESAGSDDDESDHIEIWDHVGDCYLALGKKKEALEAFQRGLKSEDISKKDAERRRKVTEKVNKLKKELK